MRGINLASCFSGVEDGIGYYASKLATSRPSPPLAAGAFPKFESVCDTIFLLYSRLRTSSRGHITKKSLATARLSNFGWKMGFEPTTFGTTIRHSNRLSYIHHIIRFRIGDKSNTVFYYKQIYQRFFYLIVQFFDYKVNIGQSNAIVLVQKCEITGATICF